VSYGFIILFVSCGAQDNGARVIFAAYLAVPPKSYDPRWYERTVKQDNLPYLRAARGCETYSPIAAIALLVVQEQS